MKDIEKSHVSIEGTIKAIELSSPHLRDDGHDEWKKKAVQRMRDRFDNDDLKVPDQLKILSTLDGISKSDRGSPASLLKALENVNPDKVPLLKAVFQSAGLMEQAGKKDDRSTFA